MLTVDCAALVWLGLDKPLKKTIRSVFAICFFYDTVGIPKSMLNSTAVSVACKYVCQFELLTVDCAALVWFGLTSPKKTPVSFCHLFMIRYCKSVLKNTAVSVACKYVYQFELFTVDCAALVWFGLTGPKKKSVSFCHLFFSSYNTVSLCSKVSAI